MHGPSSSGVPWRQTDPGKSRLAFLHQARSTVQAKTKVHGPFYNQVMDVLDQMAESEFWCHLAHLSIARLVRVESRGQAIDDSEKRRAFQAGQLRLS